MLLDDILARINGLPEDARKELERATLEATSEHAWVPNPGPQSDAYFSPADELFFGGQAGGGKTALGVGLALGAHQSSLLLRRTNHETQGIVEEIARIRGNRDGFNGQMGIWRIGERRIEVGGCQLEDDKQKYKGLPHDLYYFDEVSDFSESQYLFISAWNRTTIPGQRCRVVCGGNPPTRPEGLWVVKRWAAWLDPHHPNPAEPGELRWYVRDEDGNEQEVDGVGPHLFGGRMLPARSRTFIPSTLRDNPDLRDSGYEAVLSGLPEDLRAAYRDGRFDRAQADDAWQTLPTSWVQAAQDRWTRVPPVGVPMCCIGVDIAQGGSDMTVLAPRHDGWYAPLIAVPGIQTPDGRTAAGLVLANRRDEAKVVVDVGGGWGADCYAHLRENGIDAKSYMGIKPSGMRTANRQHGFVNIRSAAYWLFREALDPSQPQGSTIALPPDRGLLADLCAARYTLTPRGYAVEAKADVCKRLGRSTDRGDAVIMSWWDGMKQANVEGGWKGKRSSRRPQVHLGYEHVSR